MIRLTIIAALAVIVWACSMALPVRSAQACVTNPPHPNTYEATRDRGPYLAADELAGFNMIAPNDTFFGIPTVESGPRANRGTATPYIPPTLMKAIGVIESNMAHAASSVPWGGVGPVLVSFDCGYGIMQITSGMTSPQDNGRPSSQQALVATHYLYDIARGAAILVEKWNTAPEARPVVGNGDPGIVEDWYYALWGYNGFASVNNPLNASFPRWPRTPFSCGPANDGFGHDRRQYPYQELVYGCASHPLQVDGRQLWGPQPVTLPNLNDNRWRVPLSNFPNSGSMDMPSPGLHRDGTARPSDQARGYLLGSPVLAVNQSEIRQPYAEVTIANAGTGIAAWRAVPSQPWILLNKVAGVALAPQVTCSPGAPCERSPVLAVSVDAARAPPSGEGHVRLENLITGQVVTIRVVRGPIIYRFFTGVPGVVKP